MLGIVGIAEAGIAATKAMAEARAGTIRDRVMSESSCVLRTVRADVARTDKRVFKGRSTGSATDGARSNAVGNFASRECALRVREAAPPWFRIDHDAAKPRTVGA
jgi:hypothetical protein